MESRLLSGIGVVKGGLPHLLCSYGTPPCLYTVRTWHRRKAVDQAGLTLQRSFRKYRNTPNKRGA